MSQHEEFDTAGSFLEEQYDEAPATSSAGAVGSSNDAAADAVDSSHDATVQPEQLDDSAAFADLMNDYPELVGHGHFGSDMAHDQLSPSSLLAQIAFPGGVPSQSFDATYDVAGLGHELGHLGLDVNLTQPIDHPMPPLYMPPTAPPGLGQTTFAQQWAEMSDHLRGFSEEAVPNWSIPHPPIEFDQRRASHPNALTNVPLTMDSTVYTAAQGGYFDDSANIFNSPFIADEFSHHEGGGPSRPSPRRRANTLTGSHEGFFVAPGGNNVPSANFSNASPVLARARASFPTLNLGPGSPYAPAPEAIHDKRIAALQLKRAVSVGSIPQNSHMVPIRQMTASPYPPAQFRRQSLTRSQSSLSASSARSSQVPIARLKRDDKTYNRKALDEALERVNFEDITVTELKDLLRDRGLPATGKKAVLLERLRSRLDDIRCGRVAPNTGSTELWVPPSPVPGQISNSAQAFHAPDSQF